MHVADDLFTLAQAVESGLPNDEALDACLAAAREAHEAGEPVALLTILRERHPAVTEGLRPLRRDTPRPSTGALLAACNRLEAAGLASHKEVRVALASVVPTSHLLHEMVEQVRLAQEVVRRGYAGAAEVTAARRRHAEGVRRGATVDLGTFLLDEGLISPDKLASIAFSADRRVTPGEAVDLPGEWVAVSRTRLAGLNVVAAVLGLVVIGYLIGSFARGPSGAPSVGLGVAGGAVPAPPPAAGRDPVRPVAAPAPADALATAGVRALGGALGPAWVGSEAWPVPGAAPGKGRPRAFARAALPLAGVETSVLGTGGAPVFRLQGAFPLADGSRMECALVFEGQVAAWSVVEVAGGRVVAEFGPFPGRRVLRGRYRLRLCSGPRVADSGSGLFLGSLDEARADRRAEAGLVLRHLSAVDGWLARLADGDVAWRAEAEGWGRGELDRYRQEEVLAPCLPEVLARLAEVYERLLELGRAGGGALDPVAAEAARRDLAERTGRLRERVRGEAP